MTEILYSMESYSEKKPSVSNQMIYWVVEEYPIFIFTYKYKGLFVVWIECEVPYGFTNKNLKMVHWNIIICSSYRSVPLMIFCFIEVNFIRKEYPSAGMSRDMSVSWDVYFICNVENWYQKLCSNKVVFRFPSIFTGQWEWGFN